ARNGDTSFSQRGYYGELAVTFAGLLQVGGLYQDRDGDPTGASLGIYASVPKFDTIKFSGYYLRKNMSGFADAFRLDERSLLAAERVREAAHVLAQVVAGELDG